MSQFARVLLLEFLSDNPCRTYFGETYPYLAGYLRGLGVPTVWLAIQRTGGYAGPSFYVVEPPEPQREALARVIADLAPTAILLNVAAGPVLAAMIAERAPRARVATIGQDTPRGAAPTREEVHALLGLAPHGDALDGAEGPIFDWATPDYACEVLLLAEIEPPQNVPIGRGPPCPYNRPLASNPHFADVDLGGVRQAFGCSFCVHHRDMSVEDRSRLGVDGALDGAVIQLRRYFETVPPARRATRFELSDHRLFGALGSLAERLADLHLPPSTLHFARRADEILAASHELRRSLPILAGAGHRAVLWCMGVENLSPVENERLNKGLTPEQIEEVLYLLHGLEEEFPSALTFFRECQGGYFGTILFTPWTTLDDLAANAEGFRRISRRVPPVARVRSQLGTRLILHPGTAIERLAARDGALVDGYAEPAPARDKLLEPGEVPWRFLHPEVAAVFRLVTRLIAGRATTVAADATPPDGLEGLRLACAGGSTSYLSVFEALVDLARELPKAAGEPELLAELVRRSAGVTAAWEAQKTPNAQSPGGRSAPPRATPAQALLAKQARQLAARIRAGGHELGEYRLGRMAWRDGALSLEWTNGGASLETTVSAAAESGAPAFAQVGPFRITHGAAAEPLSRGQLEVLRGLVSWVASLRPRPPG